MARDVEPRVIAWNPREHQLIQRKFARRLRYGPRVNNFGDLLGPLIVDLVTGRPHTTAWRPGRANLLTVGSIMHFAHDGDTVWGTGVNGKLEVERHTFSRLDVRALRGPLSREYLAKKGIQAPEVFGDPGLLVPDLVPGLRASAQRKQRDVVLVPNLHDHPAFARQAGTLPGDPLVLDPRSPVAHCLSTIATSRFVVSSSLHGVIIAEALGIPARLVLPGTESTFKYEDYYEGTGRRLPAPASTVAEALADGPPVPDLAWDPQPLLDAFPHDLWRVAP